jgi:hypothetical protein
MTREQVIQQLIAENQTYLDKYRNMVRTAEVTTTMATEFRLLLEKYTEILRKRQ